MPPILIVTRPIESGRSFADKFQDACTPVETILSPGLRIVPLSAVIPSDTKHIIFTSANGAAQAGRLSMPRKAHAWCVGQKTADVARSFGFDVTVGGGDAFQLISTLKAASPKGRIVHVAGRHRRGDVAENLRAYGLDCSTAIAYDQIVCDPTPALAAAMRGNRPLIIPLFSARSGLMVFKSDRTAPFHVVAISQAVADAVIDWNIDTVSVAQQPQEQAMISATCSVLQKLNIGSSVP